MILATISIQAVTNTGLFRQAQDAKVETEIAREKEQIKMAVMTEIAYQSDYSTISLEGLKKYLQEYKDIEDVTGIDSIPEGSTIVSKSNKKFELKDLFITTSYAAEEDFEYAKITYKSGRIYYVKLKGDKVGTIYNDPSNPTPTPSDPSDSNPGDSDPDPDYPDTPNKNTPNNPTNTDLTAYDDIFTYSYFNAQTYFYENRKCDDYQTLEEFKNYLVANNWKLGPWTSSTYEDYLATQNVNGYIVTGFSSKAYQMYENRTIPNTLYIPSKYNDNSKYEDNNGHGELDVVAINERIGSIMSYPEGDIYNIVTKLYIPSSVIALGRESLTCVTKYDTEIKYSKKSNLKYMESYTFGSFDFTKEGGVGEKYAKIPDSVEIFGVQGSTYWWNYYLLGNNLKTLISEDGEDGSTIYDNSASWQYDKCQSAPYMIAFFKGNIEDLNSNNLFSSVNIFGSANSTDIIYCLGENKMAIQEQNGDKFTWSEITDEELKKAIKDSIYDADDSVAQNYIDSLKVIIKNAKAKFN